uniref:Uncharacterized protein n=1 Tax=Amazona collaria TaxID=241587 RepID=A0A8B9FXI8_9PSIT
MLIYIPTYSKILTVSYHSWTPSQQLQTTHAQDQKVMLATHKFQHVPVKHIVIGEPLSIGIVWFVIKTQRTAEIQVCGKFRRTSLSLKHIHIHIFFLTQHTETRGPIQISRMCQATILDLQHLFLYGTQNIS